MADDINDLILPLEWTINDNGGHHMKWIAALILFFACTAEAPGEIQVGCRRLPAPYALTAPMILQAQPQIVQIVPVQPQVLAVPATVSVQSLVPNYTLRYGILGRRLIPKVRWSAGPVLNYQLAVPAAQQTQ